MESCKANQLHISSLKKKVISAYRFLLIVNVFELEIVIIVRELLINITWDYKGGANRK